MAASAKPTADGNVRSEEAAFCPYEKMPWDTNGWTSGHLDAIKRWVALEKIHGANFSFTVRSGGSGPSCEVSPARPARRTGYLTEGENFYGLKQNQALLEEEGERVRRLFVAIRDSHYSDVASVTVFGELFGGCYPHPDVAVDPNAVKIQQEVCYCPDIRFMAYDIAVTRTDSSREFLDYDVCMQLFRNAGFLYAEPLKTGTLQDMLSLELGFKTMLPEKLGLPPLLDKKNTAEGIVIKPLKNVVLDTKKGPQRVIFKRKVENFHERRKPRMAVASSEGKTQQQQQQGKGKGGKKGRRDHERQAKLDLLKYEMSALASEQRLVNTITKRGVPNSDSDWAEVREALVRDVLESTESENEEVWSACGGPSREMVEGLRVECGELVDMYRVQYAMTNTTL